MDEPRTNNKTIAKNTIALYFRMMFTMCVSLFTSRVILRYLGVEDYGIQSSVGGVVAMLSYFSGALQVGSSRFLTYELGSGNKEKLSKTFSSVLSIHIIFGIAIILLGETVGLWFVTHKLVIPASRMYAALWCYQISLLSFFVSITQIPYGASIISHEKMSLYAYMSIVDVSLKLLIVYLITLTQYDRLIFYSTLLFLVSLGMCMFYRIYCIRHFEETHYRVSIDKAISKQVLSYTGWNIFATTSVALAGQGITIVTNMVFNPSVVAARAIANQVDHAARGFFNNFKMASDPQIVKRYAAGDFDSSRALLLQTAKYGYFLMLLIALPIFLESESLLRIWLGQVPEYSPTYLRFAVLTSLAAVFDLCFYTALYAKGQIKENSIVSSSCFFLGFIATCVLFHNGYSPTWSAIVIFISQCLIAFAVKPIMLVKIVGYKYNEIFQLFKECLKVTVIAVIVPIIIYNIRGYLRMNFYLDFFFIVAVTVFCVALAIWTLGLDAHMKQKLLTFVRQKLSLR